MPHALPPRTDTLYYKELTSGVKAKIKLPEGASRERLDIVFLERMENKEKIDSFKLPDAQNQNGTFFPLETTRTFKEEERGVLSSDKFRYLEIRPVFQAMSIPVKVRFKLNDSTKSAASSSFNVGIAYGAKFTHTVYRKLYYKDSSKLNFLNHNFRKISFSPGIFLGPKLFILKELNTYSVLKKYRST